MWVLAFLVLMQAALTLWLLGESLGLTGDQIGEPALALLLQTVQPVVTVVVAPYVSGRRIAHVWNERAITLTMASVGCLVALTFVPLASGRWQYAPSDTAAALDRAVHDGRRRKTTLADASPVSCPDNGMTDPCAPSP